MITFFNNRTVIDNNVWEREYFRLRLGDECMKEKFVTVQSREYGILKSHSYPIEAIRIRTITARYIKHHSIRVVKESTIRKREVSF